MLFLKTTFTWASEWISFGIRTPTNLLHSLTSALSLERANDLGITHLMSVCPDYPTAIGVTNHLSIPVQDSEYEDLLIHLPKACAFIQSALDQNGKILVHCVMGVSRSSTVVCAWRELLYRIAGGY